MNYTKLKILQKKILDISECIEDLEIKWAWIKFVWSNKNRFLIKNTTDVLDYKNKINLNINKILFIIVNKITLLFFFIKKRKTKKTLVYCNEKHYKKIIFNFFNKIDIKKNSFTFYSPISIDWLKYNLNINKFYASNYKWQGHEKNLSYLNYVKLIDKIIYNDLEKIKPNRIFLIEGDSYIHNLICKNAKLLKIKTITIQNGYNIFLDPVLSWRNINSNIYISKGWCNTKFLQKYSSAKFITTGILNEKTKLSKFKKNKIACFALKPDSNKKMLDYIYDTLRKYPKFNFLIKLHPSSKFVIEKKISSLKNVTILHLEENMDYLNDVMFVISEFSSVLVDSLQRNCIPIAVCNFYKETVLKYLSLKKLGFCFDNFDLLKKKDKNIFSTSYIEDYNKINKNKIFFNMEFQQIEKRKIKLLCK